jgi:menaquinone-dependent protoporphyrinogen IX oxidase
MKALVIYDTKFGNTRRIAQAVGDALAERFAVQVVPAAEAASLPPDLDLLVVGGPTHGHGLSEGMKATLAGIGRDALRGVPAAAFDTRLQMPRWLSGSAAGLVAKHLEKAGCALVAPPESFFVARTGDNPLLPSELEHADTWARSLRGTTTAVRPSARSSA